MARVLIADDEPSILEVLKLNLELEGHETYLASDGETALRRIKAEQPEVVLLDVMMPVLDGWEVLRRIPELAMKRKPRVVMVSAKAGARDVAKGVELGACDYVTKPFEIDDILAKIAEIVAATDEEIEQRRQKLLEENRE